MRIGVDASCWANSRGYGRFAREIMHAMAVRAPAEEFLCFGDAPALAAWGGGPPNVRLIDVPVGVSPTVAASSTSSRSVGDMLRLTRAVRRERPDAFFSPSVYTYFPLPPGLPAVVTIHDTIPERFPHLTLPSPSARFFWWAKVRLALAQARLVLTVSAHAARTITAVLGVPAGRLRVATLAPSPAYRPVEPAARRAAARRRGIPDGSPWFAYVGGFNPHKRVDAVLRAHADVARERTPAPHLVLVGARADAFHGGSDDLEQLVRDAGTGDLVHWTGFLPDEELVPLLGGAVALLLPSEAEGFGLPAVEAAACGTPVVATTDSPLPELLEGGGCFVAPGDARATADGMRMLLDPARRDAMGEVARRRAGALSWDHAADVALAALYDAAA